MSINTLAMLLLERAERADILCRVRLSEDLIRLRQRNAYIDTLFESSRGSSVHAYDNLVRIRFLEAGEDFAYDDALLLDSEPPLTLSLPNLEAYEEALRFAIKDMRHFHSQVVTASCSNSQAPK
jgi:hypothetical protein